MSVGVGRKREWPVSWRDPPRAASSSVLLGHVRLAYCELVGLAEVGQDLPGWGRSEFDGLGLDSLHVCWSVGWVLLDGPGQELAQKLTGQLKLAAPAVPGLTEPSIVHVTRLLG